MTLDKPVVGRTHPDRVVTSPQKGSAIHMPSGTTSYASYTASTCSHWGEDVIFTHRNLSFVAASVGGADPWAADIIIDLAHNIHGGGRFVENAPPKYKALERYVPKAQIIQLAWKDYDVPPVDLDFWEALVDLLPKSKPTRVMVTCMGAHGRTGTCLAALLVAMGYSAADAINLIRTKHCSKAVETLSQERYVYSLTGEVWEQDPAKTRWSQTTTVKATDLVEDNDPTEPYQFSGDYRELYSDRVDSDENEPPVCSYCACSDWMHYANCPILEDDAVTA